jgi:uncharacterized protein
MARLGIDIPTKELENLCQKHHIRRLEVFGSALRDDFRPDSDVDVLVEFEPDAHVGFMALSRLQRELAALLRRPVDLVPKDGLKPLIRESVLSSAEVLYAA